MTYPANLSVVTVTGTFLEGLDEDATPAEGTITFTSTAPLLQGPEAQSFVRPLKVTRALEDGSFSVDLPASDDPDWVPQGYEYQVDLKLRSGLSRMWRVSIPAASIGGEVDLAELAPNANPGSAKTTVLATDVGKAGGVASLDEDGVVPLGQLPPDVVVGSELGTALSGKQDALPSGSAAQFLRGSDKTFVSVTKSDVGLPNVDNTADSAKPVSTAQQAALNLKAPVDNPTFTGVVSGVTKGHVGLGNVDNTSDANKPVSTATQNALNTKAPVDNPTFTGTVTGVTKTHVGLGNVDNTADSAKPVSTAQQTALNLKAPLANPTFTGTVSGVTKGHVGLGNVDNTADSAKPVSTAQQAALDSKAPTSNPTFTGTVTGVTKTHVGLGNVDNTSDANKPVSTAQQTALNLKAPLANPTFTGTVAGVTKTHVGLGNVDNTADSAKPVSTPQQTALNLKVNKADAFVSVTDYGAVGDAMYLDQRGSGIWGVSTGANAFTPFDPATYGRCFTNSVFTVPATDNTTAFRNAWDALMSSGKFAFTQRGNPTDGLFLTGYRGSRIQLRIPAGAYYISDGAGLFSLLRNAPSGTPVGVDIVGDGNFNTVLFVRIPTSGATDYLFYDTNWGNGVKIRGLTIVCTTGNERLIYHTSTGNAKRWKIEDCTFKDYKQFLEVAGGVNADRWILTGCTWTTSVAGANLMSNQTNPQAIGFDFHSPSIVHGQGGNVFDMGAGGHVRIFGGSTDMFGLDVNGGAGRFAYVHGAGGTLGYQLLPVITVNDHKFEIHEDAALVDANWNMIVFKDCNGPTIGSTRWANGLKHHIVVRGRGQVWWEGGMFGDMYVGLSSNEFAVSFKCAVYVRNAMVENNNMLANRVGYFTNDGDGLTTDYTQQVGTGSGTGIGRMIVEGCSPYGATYSGNPSTHIAVNGAPWATRSWFGRPARLQRVMNRYGSAVQFGLPAEGQTSIIQIPPGCHLMRVGIVKQGTQSGIGTNSRTWKVSDGNGTALATLTTTGTTYHVQNVSPEISRTVITDNDRTFTLSCDPATPSSAGTGAEGFFFIEYI